MHAKGNFSSLLLSLLRHASAIKVAVRPERRASIYDIDTSKPETEGFVKLQYSPQEKMRD